MSMEKSLKYDAYDLAKLFSRSDHRHAATTKVSDVISTRTSSRELSRFLDPSCNIPPWLAQVKKDQQRWPRLIKVVHKFQRLQSGSKWVGLNAMKEISCCNLWNCSQNPTGSFALFCHAASAQSWAGRAHFEEHSAAWNIATDLPRPSSTIFTCQIHCLCVELVRETWLCDKHPKE